MLVFIFVLIFELLRAAFAYCGMEFIIIAKSKDGWGVAVEGDLVAEFDTPDLARDHAEGLRTASIAAGRAADVVDLSEANTQYPLLPRPDSGG